MDESETTLDSLPLDILRDIFIRLPVESLGCLAGSCYLFEQFITKDSTLKSFFDRQATRSDVVLYGKKMTLKSQHKSPESILSKFENSKFSDQFCLDENLVLAGSHNGLVCLYQCSQESLIEYNERNIWEHPLLNQSAEGTEYHYRIFIWNPTLHRIRALPKFIGANDFVAFGYDPVNEDYKILWISRGKRNKVEVYSWKNKSWKLICQNFRYVPDDFTKRSCIVEFEGFLYWVSGVKKSDNHVISVFDMAHDRLDVIVIPRYLSEKGRLGVFKGHLSLLVNDGIWSCMKSGRDCSWTQQLSRYSYSQIVPQYWGFCGLTTNGKLMMTESRKFVLLDPITGNSETLELEFVYENDLRLFFIDYKQSLDSVYPPRAPQVM